MSQYTCISTLVSFVLMTLIMACPDRFAVGLVFFQRIFLCFVFLCLLFL